MLWEVKRSAASGGALSKEKKRAATALCCIVGGRDQGDGGALRQGERERGDGGGGALGQGERERGDSGGAGVRGAWTGLGMQVDAGFHKPASAAPQKKNPSWLLRQTAIHMWALRTGPVIL